MQKGSPSSTATSTSIVFRRRDSNGNRHLQFTDLRIDEFVEIRRFVNRQSVNQIEIRKFVDSSMSLAGLPVIDVSPLVTRTGDRSQVSSEIARACRDSGFFYIAGHGVDEGLQRQLEDASRRFFAQDLETKMAIAMARGGRAWRGYFPVGAELTSGKADLKEGIYFGAELPPDHPRVKDGTPLHGANLFPRSVPELREAVLGYIDAMTRLGHALMGGIASSLGLESSYFADHYTWEPLTLFRIFNYPGNPALPDDEPRWGVGEHTDYGLLTILKQDDTGGLQVKSRGGWRPAPPIPGTFLCNIGDMLDRMTAGQYRSTPHRVQNVTRRDRLSFPFFFDPNFDAQVRPIVPADRTRAAVDRAERWDHASVHEFEGTYGDYILAKVSKVFPQLRRNVMNGTTEPRRA
jgi:isopenicillin N synthase-like dioxygenase